VFKVAADGSLTVLHSFDATGASAPSGTLTLATDGNFYGTSRGNSGEVFRMTPDGTLKKVCKSGRDFSPNGGLIQGLHRTLYGTSLFGGANFEGTVFKDSGGIGHPAAGKARGGAMVNESR
jgi:hypothetical protein